MKLAIISDIHANYEALQAVVEDARSQGVDGFACLGDIVGYGPDPVRCVEVIQALGCPVVRGNHDEDAASDRDLGNLSKVARSSLEWTRTQLSAKQRDWLNELPYTRRVGRFLLCHASLEEPEAWSYVHSRLDADVSLSKQSVGLCFIGHTHMAAGFEKEANGNCRRITSVLHQLDDSARTLINVGSVGQPRDGDQRASYVIFDRVARTIEYRRAAYDIALTQSKIYDQQLPKELASRLVAVA